MRTREEILVKKQHDLAFITSAISYELGNLAYLDYFNTWESMGGMGWFFDECVDIAREVMYEQGSAYNNYINYWATRIDDKNVSSFSDYTGETCFDWYHMTLARQRFEQRYTKDNLSDNVEHIGEYLGCILSDLPTSDNREEALKVAKVQAENLAHERKQNILIKECVDFLKSKDLDGESMQSVLESLTN